MPSDNPLPSPSGPPRAASGGASGGSFRWTPPSPEQMARMLPQYDRWETLGHGGMGAVYKARQVNLDRMVAVKMLPPDVIDDGAEFVERFKNEARTMAKLMHPSIVAVFDSGETPDGQLYFVMEYVEGTDVQRMLKAGGRLPQEHALAIAAHVCDALEYAHKRGIIHRDIKPANILIDTEGHVKVADFGLAKMLDTSVTHGLTRSNMAMGTPDFVAPEGLVPGMSVDHRADLYAVGVMLYQMLTGEVPRGMFKLPSQKRLGIDPRFDEIVHRALEQEPEDRFQTALDLRRELDGIRSTPTAKNDGTGVMPMATVETSTAAADAPTVVTVAPQPVAGSPSSRGAKRLIAAAAIMLAFAVVSWVTLKDAGSSTEGTTVERAEPAGPAPVDWLASPPSFARPWAPEWNLKDGIATPGAEDLHRQLGHMQDGSVKVKVRLAPGYIASDKEGPFLRVELRNGTVSGKEDRRGQYQFHVFVPNRTCSLNYEEKELSGKATGPVEYLWQNKHLPTNQTPSDEIEWEFRVEGAEFTALADGKAVGSITDARIRAGVCTLSASKGMQITRLETVGVTAIPKPVLAEPTAKPVSGAQNASSPSSGTKSSPDSSLSAIRWRDVTATVREKARAIPELVIEPDSVRHGGGGKTVGTNLLPADVRDCAVWIRYTGDAQVSLRYKPEAGFAYVLAQRSQIIFQRYDKDAPASVVLRPAVPHPAGFDASQPHELLVTIQGPVIRAWRDGIFVGEAEDDTFKAGATELMFTKFTQVHKVEVAELPPPSTVPHITHWEDVTATVREEARARPELLVAPDAVRHATSGGPVSIALGQEGMPGCAVRLTHEGDGQVSWRTPSGGIFYVLSQRTKAIFQRHDKDAPSPVRLLPEVPHPSGYAHASRHELLVTLEGPLMRAWLDGRFLGEVRDDRLAHSVPEVVISKWGDVRKVEVAELTPSDEAAWTDWIGPHRAAGHFRGNFWIDEGDGISTDQPLKGSEVLPAGTRDGAIRVRYTMRDSEGVMITARNTQRGAAAERYVAQDTGKSLYIATALADGSIPRLVSEPIPAELRGVQKRTLEFRFIGAHLVATLNGTFSVSVRHDAFTEGICAVVLTKGVLVNTVETKELAADESSWTDWLGPKYGTGDLSGSGWIEVPGGFSTDREITGTQILPPSTRDCAVRLVFDLRDSNGLGITVRDRGGDRGGAAREHYVVDATVDSIYLGRMIPGGSVRQFENRKYPPEMRGHGERTLEFRCVGSELTATLDGTLKLSARDSTLPEGFVAIFLKKGVLLKKVEVQSLDAKH